MSDSLLAGSSSAQGRSSSRRLTIHSDALQLINATLEKATRDQMERPIQRHPVGSTAANAMQRTAHSLRDQKSLRGVPMTMERRATAKPETFDMLMPSSSFDDVTETPSRLRCGPPSPLSNTQATGGGSPRLGARGLESLSACVADAQVFSLRRRLEEADGMRLAAKEELEAARSEIKQYKKDLEDERQRSALLCKEHTQLEARLHPHRTDVSVETEEILLLGECVRYSKQENDDDEKNFANSFIVHAREDPKQVLDEFPGLLTGAMGGAYGKAVAFLLAERLRMQVHYELLDLLKASLESYDGKSQQLSHELYAALQDDTVDANVALPSDAIWSEVLRWQDALWESKTKEIEKLKQRAQMSGQACRLLYGKVHSPMSRTQCADGRMLVNEEHNSESPESLSPRIMHLQQLASTSSNLEQRVREVRLSEKVRRQRTEIGELEQRIAVLEEEKEALERKNNEAQRELRHMSAQLTMQIRSKPRKMLASSSSMGSLSARDTTRLSARDTTREDSRYAIRMSIREKSRSRDTLRGDEAAAMRDSVAPCRNPDADQGDRFDDYSIHKKGGAERLLGNLSLLSADNRRRRMDELKQRQKWERLQSLHIKEGSRWPNFQKFFANAQQSITSEP